MAGVAKNKVALVKAFEGIKTAHPAAWGMLQRGLVELLGPEVRHIIRVPTALLEVSQGRAQIAEDILTIMDECSELAEELRRTEPTTQSVSGQPPVFQ